MLDGKGSSMYVYLPGDWNGLLLVTDVRNRKDRELQDYAGGDPILEFWPFQRAMSRSDWRQTARIALWDCGERVIEPEDGPTSARLSVAKAVAKTKARSALHAWCTEHRPRCICVLQSRSVTARGSRLLDEEGEAEHMEGSVAWNTFSPPESLPAMAGTVFASPLGPVVGLLNPVNYEWVYGELVRRWLKQSLELAVNQREPLRPTVYAKTAGPALTVVLRTILESDAPVAIDLETFTDGDVITCIGLAQRDVAVSVPWDTFVPHGCTEPELGADAQTRELVARILALPTVKYLHNGVAFDVPKLAARELVVGGNILDTMIMFALVYPQWPKNLQAAAAAQLACPPWKSLHRAGKDLDDPTAWIQDPLELRGYNLLDAFYTLKLGESLRHEVGL